MIDLLAQSQGQYGPPPPIEDCTEEQEAAIISGEIIVCRRITDQSEFRTIDPDGAQARYAAETAYANDPQAPNVAGGGIFRGPATASGLCFIPPCPKEAALIIDVSELPEAPPGSDADRIARGLPPLGNDEGAPPSQSELVGQPEGPVTLTTGNYTHRGGPAETTRETTRETTPAESEAPEAD